MPSSSTSLLPGPHDPYNASSVKLAEATRIRLVLPSLGTCNKEEGSSSAVERSNPGDLSSKPAESAAALAKARKKLLKIQGIASQADKAHSSVIVDLGVLAGEAAAGEEQAAAQGRGQASNATSIAAGRSSESVGPREKRSSKQGAAAGTAPAAGAGSPSSQLKPRTAAASGDSVKRLSSRLAPSSPSAAAGDASADSTGGSCGSRSAVASSRNKGQPDKPYVPIWERLLPPTALAEEKKVAATAQRVLQPVALKTFSPTLGSLGCGLAQQVAGRPSDEAAAATAPAVGGSRSRSAAKFQGQPPDVAAAAGAPHTHIHARQGDGARAASKPVAAAATDLGAAAATAAQPVVHQWLPEPKPAV